MTKQLLDKHREALLDLSPTNRLMSMPLDDPGKNFLTFHKSDEASLYQRLVEQEQVIYFVSTRNKDAEIPYLKPKGAEVCVIETPLAADALHKKLKSLHQMARDSVEEKGINSLHLALGICSYVDKGKAHSAPVLMVPVKLTKERGLKKPFRMAWTEEDVELNPCLEVYARKYLGVSLPAFDTDKDQPMDYLERVDKMLTKEASQAFRAEVKFDTTGLGHFDFTKFAIYRDLDTASWPAEQNLLESPLGALISGGPAARSGGRHSIEDGPQETEGENRRCDHIADADESQAEVIQLTRDGHQVVVQGPPGTGKSQTITNIIATAILDGKTVLFVCEKSAALEVVRDRMTAAGLGSALLELHTDKATKKAVLAELNTSWMKGLEERQKQRHFALVSANHLSSELDKLAADLHSPVSDSGLTPHQLAAYIAEIEANHDIGVPPSIPEVVHWNDIRFSSAKNSVRRLAASFNRIVDPSCNSWSNSHRTSRVTSSDLRRLKDGISVAAEELGALRQASAALADKMGFAHPLDPDAAKHLAVLADVVTAAPGSASSCIFDDTISLHRLRYVVDSAMETAHERQDLMRIFGREALEALTAYELEALQKSGSWRGFFDIRCHAAKRKLWRNAVRPTDAANLNELPKKVSRFRVLLDEVARSTTDAERYFGAAWKGIDSDWPELSRTVSWRTTLADLGIEATLARQLAAVANKTALASEAAEVRCLLESLETSFGSLESSLGVRRQDPPSLGYSSFGQIADQLGLWIENLLSLPDWVEWKSACAEGERAGVGNVMRHLINGKIPAATAEEGLRFCYYRELLDLAETERPSISSFRTEQHEERIREFCETDRKVVANARRKVQAAYLSRLPDWASDDQGAITLREQIKISRRHLPIRTLLETTGGIVQKIKPVFMMSPLSVAKHLSPGGMNFDLLVVDEASQIPPVEAFGAIARTRQHVVVGDEKQLPPTSFFKRTLADEDDEDNNEEDISAEQPIEMESILSLCAARSFRPAMLRWHFRSQHESLIQFSNEAFYHGGLIVPPSPDRDPVRKGLSFMYVEDGVYFDRCNEKEACAIAEAVKAHVEKTPDLSLGVVAFSQKQKEVIEQAVEELAEKNHDLAAFISRPNKYFVKNLESVQGDERDVIFISFCYSRNQDGKFEQRFGPLTKAGGQRRLNVIASRAKMRCVLFASIHSSALNPPHPDSLIHHLKNFMRFAEECSAGQQRCIERRDNEALLAHIMAAISRRLTEAGYATRTLGDGSGCKVDLAVVDPHDESRLLLAILTDDHAYGSLTQARDRDRLHIQMLQNVGWDKIVRIWTLDWMHDSEGQMERIFGILEDSANAPGGSMPGANATLEGDLYTEAERPDSPLSFHRMSPKDLAGEIHRILSVESPMCPKLLNERLKDFLGIERLSNPVQTRIANSVGILKEENRCEERNGCLFVAGKTMRLRNRSNLNPKPAAELIPKEEITLAAEKVLSEYFHSGEEAVDAAALLLGYQRPGEYLKQALRSAFRTLKKERREKMPTLS
jgi:Protein of unknown function (DUF4011)/REase_MTES_1575/AAA domain